MSPHRYLNGYVPKSVAKGRVLMHHGSNWPTDPNGFRAWTVPCPCGWAGLPHYAAKGRVESYREKRYQRGVKQLERKHAILRSLGNHRANEKGPSH
jgi:hypothetical protein